MISKYKVNKMFLGNRYLKMQLRYGNNRVDNMRNLSNGLWNCFITVPLHNSVSFFRKTCITEGRYSKASVKCNYNFEGFDMCSHNRTHWISDRNSVTQLHGRRKAITKQNN